MYPKRRPTATEALTMWFFTGDMLDLNRLYVELVVRGWVAQDITAHAKLEVITPESDKIMMDCTDRIPLTEIDVNALEITEKKRVLAEGKENDLPNEDDVEPRKRRKLLE
jgi:hypothetical protein